MIKIKGKQLSDATITQDKMAIVTASIVAATDVTTKEYVENAINSGISNLSYSSSNFNMTALATSGSVPLQACTTGILDIPQGGVRVYVNGVEVNVGGKISPYDCYFSADAGSTAKTFGSESQGDILWWNCSVAPFELDITDSIDFVYMTYTVIA